MRPHITSAKVAEHYKWGETLDVACDGWHLVRTAELSVIEEMMPPGATEERHYHVMSRQFFYVLEGEMTMEVEHQYHLLTAGQGLEIAPGQSHQAINNGQTRLRMLVISQPPSHSDRTSS